MSLPPQIENVIPEETARVANAAFPKGNLYMKIHEVLGPLFTDAQFADLFPRRGQPAQAPWRLALVSVMQFAENLSDRQTAEAVRSRIDWKYTLALELTDPGFDYSVLCEFRARLLHGGAEQRLLETLLALSRERGWLKARGKQRTDSTHVLAAIHALNRLENVGVTLRHALNVLTEVAPDWLASQIQPEWIDRYSKRFENYRLPRDEAERKALAVTVGKDGLTLLHALYSNDALEPLSRLPAVDLLRQVWVQQFVLEGERLCWRDAKQLPPGALLINSPYDAEARYSIKRDTVWTGYKVHLTESCSEDSPHLITHVQTTAGTTQDSDVTADIHTDLANADLLPGTHFMDAGYLDAPLLVESRKDHGIELMGPVARDGSWQAVAGQGFAQSQFRVDWEAQQVTCPRGKLSRSWLLQKDSFDNAVIHVKFSHTDCQTCAVRALCTRSTRREIAIRPKEQYLALQDARTRQHTDEFRKCYGMRAGIEGTLSQGIWVCGMRRSRYIGQAKTHLQNVVIATSLNLLRIGAWLMDVPLAKTRPSRFAVLARLWDNKMVPNPA